MFRIEAKKMLNNATVQLKIAAAQIAVKVKPGQFIMLKIDQKGERIPLTVADYDRVNGTIDVIVQMVGYSTIQLASLEVGDYILDVIGPLGVPTELDGYSKVMVIGGGVGCAIAYPQAKYLYNTGVDVSVIAGFRTKDLVILEDEMKAVSKELFITTDDGTYMEKGFVTTKLEALIQAGVQYDLVIAIGPVVMMKAVAAVTKQYDIKTIVSLNPIMIDGTGMCGGCRVIVGGKVKFACVDGPDFDAHEVDFDILMRRNAAYRGQEQIDYEHACRIFSTNEVTI
ncbi:MAG: sulfide/dihydroorotate dehydrogenase-like FAD/NAD-binding protein [Oscillospiraceae bacterium]|nr:sulfide/dihydroorotate dehydrogenase-like FAD/NAD-binding protein [Oscillospiraceae bacterium]